MNLITQLLKSISGTIANRWVWLMAILSRQPVVVATALPLVQIGPKLWRMTQDYTSLMDGTNATITIRTGFVSDLASIPEQVHGLLGLTNDSPCISRGALIHDALYASELVGQTCADRILQVACLDDGMTPLKARAVYDAVELWGWIAYEQHTPASIAEARGLVSISVRGQL